jgi:outer membrane protein assembly factor BamD (BamD/ComL family)
MRSIIFSGVVLLLLIFHSCKKENGGNLEEKSFILDETPTIIELQDNIDSAVIKTLLKKYPRSIYYDSIEILDTPSRIDEIIGLEGRINSKYIEYAKIVSAYEAKDFSKLRPLIEKTFNKNIINPTDFVIAAYYGLGLFEEAIRLKIENKTGNVSTDDLLDYAKCLRNIGLVKSRKYAEQLISELNNPVLDNIWIYTPFEVSSCLFRGIHNKWAVDNNLEEVDIEGVKKYIKDNPKTDITYLAYYLLGDYEQSLRTNTSGDFEDVLLYAAGHSILKSYSFNYYESIGKNLSVSETNKVNNAIKYLKEYVSKYPSHMHADDAAYWLAFGYSLLTDYPAAFEWLNSMEKLGNQDSEYIRIGRRFKTQLLDKVSVDLAIRNIDFRSEVALLAKILSQLPKDEALDKLVLIINSISIPEKDGEFSFEMYNLEQLISCLLYKYSIKELEGITLSINNEDKRNIFSNIMSEKSSLLDLSSYRNDTSRVIFYFEDKESRIELLEANDCESLISSIKRLRNIHYWREYVVSDLIIQRINKIVETVDTCENLDYLLYLKILALKSFEDKYIEYTIPDRMPELIIIEDLVYDLLEKFPNSTYADDALADLVYLELFVFDRYKKGEKIALELMSKFPNSNAIDNTLNWLATASVHNENKFTYYNELLIDLFPDSYFSKYARIRLEEFEFLNNVRYNIFYLEEPIEKYHLIVGSYKLMRNAKAIVAQLKNHNYHNCFLIRKNDRFLVSLNNYPSRKQASSNLRMVTEIGLPVEPWILYY